MLRRKGKKELDNSTRASVKKEMAKPRMAKSVRESQINLAAARGYAPKRRLLVLD
jgi:hypothetical protein